MSGDAGKTWTEHGNIRLTPDSRYFGWAENDLFEHPDGRITMIIRADGLGGMLYQALFVGVRSCKCAFRMTKQLRFDELFW